NSHEKFSSFKSLGVDGYGGISKFSCGAGGFIHGCHLLKLRQVSVFQNRTAQFSIVAVKAHNQWLRLNTFGFQDAECLNNALSNLVAGGNAAEDVDKDGLDLHVAQDHLKTIGHDFRICTAPDVEEVCWVGLTRKTLAGIGNNIQRGHHKTCTIADNTDGAVKLDVVSTHLLSLQL